MKKSTSAIIGLIVVVIVVVGGFALFHNAYKTTKTASSTTPAKSSAPAVNNAVLTTKTDATLGQYLADPNGSALYTYGADTTGVSNCTGACLSAWPAYQATSSTTSLPTGVTIIKRTDNGQMQYAYNGMPLYTFASDSSGKVTGNGVDNFKIATPAANTSAGSSSNSSSSNPYNY
jgi:predicted lipoprotein with Yx(FWY)xxD motif